MKQNYLKAIYVVLLLFNSLIFAQTPQQIKTIKEETNVTRLNEIARVSRIKAQEAKEEAWRLADQNGWKKRFIDNNGSYNELMAVSPEGKPIYYQTENLKSIKKNRSLFSNVDAATSTRANWLHNGGGLGLNIEGQGMTAYVWDGGTARPTHQEYDGIGGQDRVTIGNESQEPLNFHAAHVMGTIVSSGFIADAKGMAPQAKGIAFDWSSDESEVASESANGMLLSNHSYGLAADNIPDFWFGAYLDPAREWDEIMFNGPLLCCCFLCGK